MPSSSIFVFCGNVLSHPRYLGEGDTPVESYLDKVFDRNTSRSVHNLASLAQSVCTMARHGKINYYSTFFLHVLCGSLPAVAAFSLLFQDKLLYVRILACFVYLLIRYV